MHPEDLLTSRETAILAEIAEAYPGSVTTGHVFERYGRLERQLIGVSMRSMAKRGLLDVQSRLGGIEHGYRLSSVGERLLHESSSHGMRLYARATRAAARAEEQRAGLKPRP